MNWFDKHSNSIDYNMDMSCHFDRMRDDCRWLNWHIFIPENVKDGHFNLEYDNRGEMTMITEECNIQQLKRLYILLKGVFENEG